MDHAKSDAIYVVPALIDLCANDAVADQARAHGWSLHRLPMKEYNDCSAAGKSNFTGVSSNQTIDILISCMGLSTDGGWLPAMQSAFPKRSFKQR